MEAASEIGAASFFSSLLLPFSNFRLFLELVVTLRMQPCKVGALVFNSSHFRSENSYNCLALVFLRMEGCF